MPRHAYCEAQSKAKKTNRLRSMEDLLGLSNSNLYYSTQKVVDTEIVSMVNGESVLYGDEEDMGIFEQCKTPRRRGRPRKIKSSPDYNPSPAMSSMDLQLDSDSGESFEFGIKVEKADFIEGSGGTFLTESKYSACDETPRQKSSCHYRVSMDDDPTETKEEDEWTLQMWQQKYLNKSKKRNGRNKSQAKHNFEQSECNIGEPDRNTEHICTASDEIAETMAFSKVDAVAKDSEDNFDYCSEVIDDLESGGLLVADIEKYDDSAYLSFANPTVTLELEDESENGMSNLSGDEDEEEATCSSSLSTPVSLDNIPLEKKSLTLESETSVEKLVEREQTYRVPEDDSSHEVRKQIDFSESRATGPEQTKDVYEFSPMEVFDMDEDSPPKPTRIPCKRKAISPSSQEMLLKASRLGDFPDNEETRKPKQLKVSNEDVTVNRICDLVPRSSTAKHILKTCSASQLQTPLHGNDHSSLMRSSPPLHASRCTDEKTGSFPSGPSPLQPRKGILRSTHSTCRGLCHCESCVSIRSRAAKASEFSQRQMQDIEGLAVKLMKDLSMLRGIVEDKLISKTPRNANLSIDQLKTLTSNALETEETAKRWLIRMARDCNRYCKIMRFQERKLTFADEAGGQLCHIKLFHSKQVQEPTSVNASDASPPQEEMLVVAP